MVKLTFILAVATLVMFLVSHAAAQAGDFCYNNPAGEKVVFYDTSVGEGEEAEPSEPDTATGYRSCLTSAGDKVYFEKVIFPSFDGTNVYGYIFRPEGKGPFPGALILHGGWHGRALAPLGVDRAETMAKAGYVVMHFDHRGSVGHGMAFRDAEVRDGQPIKDCLKAAEYLAALPYVDKNRLVVRGFSRGAYLTSTVIQRTDIFKAAAMWCGYFQIQPDVEKGATEPTQDALAKWHEFSPYANAAKTNGAILLMHSIEDDTLSPEQSLKFAEALTRAGKEFTLVMLHNAGHGAKDPVQMKRGEDTIMRFFADNLK